MPLAYRIAAGFSILLVVMVALAGYHLNLFRRQSAEIFRLSNTTGLAAQLTVEIEAGLGQLATLTLKVPAYDGLDDTGALSTAGSEYRNQIASVRESISQDLRALSGLGLSNEEKLEVAILKEIWEGFRNRAELQELRAAGSSPASESLVEQSLARMQRQLKKLHFVSRTTVNRKSQELIRRTRQAELAAQLAALAGLIFALVGSLVVGRSILRPVRRIARGAKALAEGDFTYRVPESGGQEMVALARDFNSMAARIGQLDQLKKDLVSNVSHDLKAPLASMQETTRLLLEELPGPLNAQQLRLLNLNLSSGERLSRMISDLLDLSRLEAGVEPQPVETLNLGSLLRTTVEELENLLKERGQTFRLELPPRLVEVEGQPTALAQVLTNLLSNALKFTARAGALGARLEGFETLREPWLQRLAPSLLERMGTAGGPGALVEIWDSGPGVPEEHKERIFRRFHRVDSHRKGAQGTGLGLAIAAAIVAQHHGALWVDDRPGGGSSFKLLLWHRLPAELAGDLRQAFSPQPPAEKEPPQ